LIIFLDDDISKYSYTNKRREYRLSDDYRFSCDTLFIEPSRGEFGLLGGEGGFC
jgi:hypothetical protein